MSYIKESTLEKMIIKQIKFWKNSKNTLKKEPEKPKPFITISRQYGCNASSIAYTIAEELNRNESTDQWRVYDKDIIDKIVEDHNIAESLIETIDTKKRKEISELLRTMLTDYPPQVSVYKKLVKTIQSLSVHGRAIIVGRAGVVITRGLKYGIHVRFIAPLSYRTKQIMKINNMRNKLKAEKLIETKDKERHDFLTQYVRFDAYNPASYDLTINISRFSQKEIAGIVLSAVQSKGFLQ